MKDINEYIAKLRVRANYAQNLAKEADASNSEIRAHFFDGRADAIEEIIKEIKSELVPAD